MPDAGRAVSAIGLDDPAELYHDASKLEPALAAQQFADLRRFAAQPALRQAAERPVRRHPWRDSLLLPAPVWPEVGLEEACRRRRSTSELGGGDLTVADVALLLAAACGVTGTIAGAAGNPIGGRAAPSGGALYPLDLYVVPLRCPELPSAVHRYDPELHALQEAAPAPPPGELGACFFQPEITASAGVVVALAGVFARSRVKYGLRGYRYVLLEAGHAVQGALLAAAAAGIRTVPLGGVVDRRLERLVGVDGLHESLVYAFAAGRAVEEPA